MTYHRCEVCHRKEFLVEINTYKVTFALICKKCKRRILIGLSMK